MFCVSCGNQIPDGSVNCPNCGAAQQAAPQQPVYQQPVYQQPVYQQPTYVAPQVVRGAGMASACLVMGILSFIPFASFVFGLLAIIFFCVAKGQGYHGGKTTAGLICGIIGIVITIAIIGSLIEAAGDVYSYAYSYYW